MGRVCVGWLLLLFCVRINFLVTYYVFLVANICTKVARDKVVFCFVRLSNAFAGFAPCPAVECQSNKTTVEGEGVYVSQHPQSVIPFLKKTLSIFFFFCIYFSTPSSLQSNPPQVLSLISSSWSLMCTPSFERCILSHSSFLLASSLVVIVCIATKCSLGVR